VERQKRSRRGVGGGGGGGGGGGEYYERRPCVTSYDGETALGNMNKQNVIILQK
jgi:hypothetical protein